MNLSYNFLTISLVFLLSLVKSCFLTWFPLKAEDDITKSVPKIEELNSTLHSDDIRNRIVNFGETVTKLEKNPILNLVHRTPHKFKKNDSDYEKSYRTLRNATFNFKNSRHISTNENGRYFDETTRNITSSRLGNHFKCGRRKILRRRSNNTENLKNRGKFLEIFQVVNIENGACVISSGLDGTCLHEYQCNGIGGVDMGDCADGFGVCCVFQLTCDEETSVSSSWFTNPGFPNPSDERLACAVTINKASEDIVQIKLEFTAFELQPPTDGGCLADQFVVSGQSANSIIPILCGINNGQHMYIDVSDAAGPVYLSVQTIASASRLFAVKVTQMTSSEAILAGCLQYYSGKEVVLESFNYQDKSTLVINRLPSYMNNMNYAMCIQREAGHCSITYSNVEDDSQCAFQIPNYDTYGLPTIPPNQAGVETYNCPNDYLATAGLRLCGERLNDGSFTQDFSLNAPVTDTSAGPIVMLFRSDSSIVGRGFRLHYKQNPCSDIS